MKIVCISDLHGDMPQLPEGDLLIVAGDLTALDTEGDYLAFLMWIAKTPHRKRIVICGNHDRLVQKGKIPFKGCADFDYLEDSGTEFEGLKIWGSPYTLRFREQNPRYAAFTEWTDREMRDHWEKIPKDVDILITHAPPHGCLDQPYSAWSPRCGDYSLRGFYDRGEIKPFLHVFGHIHDGYGVGSIGPEGKKTVLVNAARMNREYNPVNKPIVYLHETEG